MNAILREIIETGFCKSQSGERIKVDFHIPTEVGEFLHAVVADARPAVSLEVGFAFGVSAMFICDALVRTQHARHIAIDPVQLEEPFSGQGLYNLKRAGYEGLLDFRNLSSHLALPRLEEEGCKVDFAFIDGIHTFDHTLVDFFLVDRILRVGGVVAFDDCDWVSVRKVCRFIATNRAYSVFRCVPPTRLRGLSLQHKLLNAAANRIGKLRDALKADFLEPDVEIGLLPSRCVAFRKESEDTRHWSGNDHRDF